MVKVYEVGEIYSDGKTPVPSYDEIKRLQEQKKKVIALIKDGRFVEALKLLEEKEEDIDQIAYKQACNEFMKFIEGMAGQDELYWLVEIMLEDAFDYTPSQRNPFAVRKVSTEKERPINPYKLMMTYLQ